MVTASRFKTVWSVWFYSVVALWDSDKSSYRTFWPYDQIGVRMDDNCCHTERWVVAESLEHCVLDGGGGYIWLLSLTTTTGVLEEAPCADTEGETDRQTDRQRSVSVMVKWTNFSKAMRSNIIIIGMGGGRIRLQAVYTNYNNCISYMILK